MQKPEPAPSPDPWPDHKCSTCTHYTDGKCPDHYRLYDILCGQFERRIIPAPAEPYYQKEVESDEPYYKPTIF